MPKSEIYRFSSDLTGLPAGKMAVIKLGFFWYDLWGLWHFWQITDRINQSTKGAGAWGLYSSEYFLFSAGHAGLIQYWKSFEDLEKWSTKSDDHTSWWKHIETHKDIWEHLGIYHEVFLVERSDIETVYNVRTDLPQADFPGLSQFLPHISPTKYRARERFLKT